MYSMAIPEISKAQATMAIFIGISYIISIPAIIIAMSRCVAIVVVVVVAAAAAVGGEVVVGKQEEQGSRVACLGGSAMSPMCT